MKIFRMIGYFILATLYVFNKKLPADYTIGDFIRDFNEIEAIRK
jgi:hypothetical protein